MSEEMTPEEEAEKLIRELVNSAIWYELHKDYDMSYERTALMGIHRLLDDHFKPALDRVRRLNARIAKIDLELCELGKQGEVTNAYKIMILKNELNLLRNI